jgi:uncharacterized ferritin-like protein (DUF455 family)
MNEEINSVEMSARCLADFPDADWELCMSMARQCADEARHAVMFRQLFEARGGTLGDYPILNFQYRIVTKIDHLIGRLAVQNRSFEADGLDAIQYGLTQVRERGDDAMAALFEAQLADEMLHVRYANEWIRAAVRQDPRHLLRISAALTAASDAFLQVMGQEGTASVRYVADTEGRLEAGFLPAEVSRAAALTAVRHTTTQSTV